MKLLTTSSSISSDGAAVSEPSALNGAPERPVADDKTLRHAPPWGVFVIFILAIIFLLALFGWSVRSATVFVAELLVATAALAVGALFGFLFGIPRGPAEATDPAASPAPTDYRPSNSLEQVSEWLTKILVGAGLVQLAQIKTALNSLGTTITGSLSAPPPATGLVSQLVAIVFVVYGFLVSFLWTRLYYGRIQTIFDRNLRVAFETEKKKKEQYRSLASDLATGAITTPKKPATETKEFRTTAAVSEWPPDVREKFRMFKEARVDWNDDTAVRLFGVTSNVANDKVLEAHCDGDLRRSVAITLRAPGESLKADSRRHLVWINLRPPPVIADSAMSET